MNRLHHTLTALAFAGVLISTPTVAPPADAQAAFVRDVTTLSDTFIGLARVMAGRSVSAGPQSNDALVGLWKLVRGSFNGKEFTVRDGQMVLKLQTATAYVWVDIDENGNVVDLVGGTYTLAGGKYQPRPTFGAGAVFNRVKGTTQSFDFRVVGNTWHHSGTLSDGKSTIDEMWERVE